MPIIREEILRGKKTGFWVYDYSDAQGNRHQKRARNKSLAQAFLSKALREKEKEMLYGKQAFKKTIFDQFTKEYLFYSESSKKHSSYKRDCVSIKALKKAFSGKILSAITIKNIEKYKMSRRLTNKPATVNRELACLKNMFTKAIQWDYAYVNPVKQVKFYKENNTIVRYLDPNERVKLIACCDDYLKPMVIISLYTGMRKGELLNLKWSDVDFNRKLITIRETKNNEVRYIPMCQTLTEVLKSVKKRVDIPYVFHDKNGKKLRETKYEFSKALKQSGISNFRWHDLRHTYASYLVMSGVDITTVSRLLGHKNLDMTLRYSHLSPKHQQEAANKLEAYINNDKPDTDANYAQIRKANKSAV